MRNKGAVSLLASGTGGCGGFASHLAGAEVVAGCRCFRRGCKGRGARQPAGKSSRREGCNSGDGPDPAKGAGLGPPEGIGAVLADWLEGITVCGKPVPVGESAEAGRARCFTRALRSFILSLKGRRSESGKRLKRN